MKEIKLEVITPSKKAIDDEVLSVTLPGTDGNFQVLYNHAPLLSSLEIGVVKVVTTDNKEKIYSISGGTAEVVNNRVLVLAESIESQEEIDVRRAEEAKERAEKRLHAENKKDIDVDRAEIALKRAINRLNTAHKSI